MIPRLKPDLSWHEIATLFKINKLDDVPEFECAFATLMGKKHAIFFPYGRTGLLFLLEALGISDQEIICPAYTCVVVPHAIVISRNEPIFVTLLSPFFAHTAPLVFSALLIIVLNLYMENIFP